MRPLRIFFKSITSAFKSVFRNFSLSIASLSCIIITLLIVSIGIIIGSNINNFTKEIENDLTIVVFVKNDVDHDGVLKLKNEIGVIPNIKQYEYLDKNQIKENMQQEDETFNKIMSDWEGDENPLEDCFVITVENIENISETAQTLKNLENVDTIEYGKGKVEKLVSVFDTIKKATIITVLALIFVTAFLISNTIKITIYSRKNEIDIMRLVGTSNTVIKLPFLIEGFFLGILGSLIPILATVYGYVLFYDKMGGALLTNIIPLIEPFNFIFKVSGFLLIIGSIVGVYGSAKAVRKYLKI